MSIPAPTGPTAIERRAETPYYQQLARILEGRLGSGEIPASTRLPSESALCREFGVSRATVRQAFQHLEARGAVHRVTNRGVFAGGRDTESGWSVRDDGFLENAVTQRDRPVTTRVVRSGDVVLPAFVHEEFDLPPGSEGFALVRVRFLDGIPAAYSVDHFPAQLGAVVAEAPGVLAGTASLSTLLTSSGYRLQRSRRSMRAVLPSDEVVEGLAIDPGTPVVQVRATSCTADGLPFDVSETHINTAVVPLEIALDR